MIKQTYFSQSYNLTKTLQQHFVEGLKSDFYQDWHEHYSKSPSNKKVNKILIKPDVEKLTRNMFLWNDFHIKDLFEVLDNRAWFTWFIYGFVAQNSIFS